MEHKISFTLIYIILTTLCAGLLSISLAALISYQFLGKFVERMVSLSVGVMLSTTFLHALPTAFESQANPRTLFACLLAGLFGFFLLEKMAILRHSHHHEGDGHHHEHGHDKHEAGKAGWMILVGDGMHNFTDGILIAAAFLTDVRIGLMTSLAIIVHELPQEIGDFIVLHNAGFSRKRAYIYNLISSLMGVLGGVMGFFILTYTHQLIPYFLVLASSAFIYIAVSDLIPQMQKRTQIKETIPQVLLISVGVVIVMILNTYLHHD